MGQGGVRVKESGEGSPPAERTFGPDTETLRITFRCKWGKKETQQRGKRVSREGGAGKYREGEKWLVQSLDIDPTSPPEAECSSNTSQLSHACY